MGSTSVNLFAGQIALANLDVLFDPLFDLDRTGYWQRLLQDFYECLVVPCLTLIGNNAIINGRSSFIQNFFLKMILLTKQLIE